MSILYDMQKAIEQIEALNNKHCERYDYYTCDKELAEKLMKEIPGFKVKILPQHTSLSVDTENKIYVTPTSDKPIKFVKQVGADFVINGTIYDFNGE